MDGRHVHGGPDPATEGDAAEPAWAEGRVPWTASGLATAFAEFAASVEGRAPGPAAAGRPDPVERYVRWFTERYGEDQGPAHALRFYLARQFLVEHSAVLARAGLLRRIGVAALPADGPPAFSVTVTAGLVRALATLPFSLRPPRHGSGGCARAGAAHDGRGFDLDEVIAVARSVDARGVEAPRPQTGGRVCSE